MISNNLALYVHWPFCKSKCPYCDFNSHVRDQIDLLAWSEAYLTEIEYFEPQIAEKTITSIFFGGGTPSLMPASIVRAIIDKASKVGNLADNIEITLEANPTSVEASKFKEFKNAGINRVSLGIQSLNPDDLKFLGREHSKEEALKAIELAANNFDRYSFDLIYFRPNQTVKSWEEELKEALKYTKDHLSVYQLTVEKGTPFYSLYKNKGFSLPNEEVAYELYTITQDILNQQGLPAYEVSNHAKIGAECQHNLAYWRYEDYLGIGPGAHSRLKGEAVMMIHNPENWLKSIKINSHGIQQRASLSEEEKLEELLLMGLRLTEGINLRTLEKRFNKPYTQLLPMMKLNQLTDLEFIEIMDNQLKATSKGMLVLNKIIEQLIK